MNKTTFDTRIDGIFDKYRDAIKQGLIGGKKYADVASEAEQEAKAQLRTLVNDVCMEAIGEDEQIETDDGFGNKWKIDSPRNELRATQRTKLAAILEGSE